MRLHWLMTALMIIWAGVPFVVLTAALHPVPGIGASTAACEARGELFGAAAVMLSIGYGLCSVCFNLEARRARELLVKMLDASAT